MTGSATILYPRLKNIKSFRRPTKGRDGAILSLPRCVETIDINQQSYKIKKNYITVFDCKEDESDQAEYGYTVIFQVEKQYCSVKINFNIDGYPVGSPVMGYNTMNAKTVFANLLLPASQSMLVEFAMDRSLPYVDRLRPTWAKLAGLVAESGNMTQQILGQSVAAARQIRMNTKKLALSVQSVNESVAALEARMDNLERLMAANPNMIFNKRKTTNVLIHCSTAVSQNDTGLSY